MGRGWWVTQYLETPEGKVILAAWVIWVVVSITLHELAHGWAAISRGDDTPIHTGHMTWNPVVHMGLPAIVAFVLTGITWGAMPVDSTRLRGRYAEAWVAFAGPLMNFALALVCVLLGGLWVGLETQLGVEPEMHRNIRVFFAIGAGLNLILAMLNLLPIPPLDGSRILSNFSRGYRDMTMSQTGQYASILVFLAVFIFGGKYLFPAGFGAAHFATELIGGVLQAFTR